MVLKITRKYHLYVQYMYAYQDQRATVAFVALSPTCTCPHPARQPKTQQRTLDMPFKASICILIQQHDIVQWYVAAIELTPTEKELLIAAGSGSGAADSCCAVGC